MHVTWFLVSGKDKSGGGFLIKKYRLAVVIKWLVGRRELGNQKKSFVLSQLRIACDSSKSFVKKAHKKSPRFL